MHRTVLITGASSGVGHALTHHLASDYRVIAVARRIDRLREAFGTYANVECVELDLSDSGQLREFTQGLPQRYGYIPYLINNAGVNIRVEVSELTHEQLSRSVAVNAVAPLALMQALLPQMQKENFGRIVNVTSGAPLNCFAQFGAYSASKAALNALSVTAAREYQDYNIKINLMSPGPVQSEMAPQAPMSPDVAFPTVEYLLSLPPDGPTGRFFWLGYEIPLFPDLDGIEWLEGRASSRFRKVL